MTPTPTAAPAPSPDAPPGEGARAAGRGGLAIAGAKLAFILLGFVQQLILPRLLGVAGYGEISRVFSWVGVVNNVTVATSIQGVSRSVSSAPAGGGPAALRQALRAHAWIAVALAALFFLAAEPIASFARAPHVLGPLRLSAGVVLLYGIYAPLVGGLNGQRRFVAQASLDVAYGVLRTVGMVAGAWLFLRSGGSGVSGAVTGFVTAACLIVPAALFATGVGAGGAGGRASAAYLKFLVPLAVGQVFLNLLMQADGFLLSRYLGEAANTLGFDRVEADRYVGVYRGVQLFAFLPYQMMMSVSFVLFPMLASSAAAGDRAAVKAYTATGLRLALLLTGLMCAPIASLAPQVLSFAFPEPIGTLGGSALRVLCFGMGAFALLGVSSTALVGLGHARAAATLTAFALLLVATGCALFVPTAAFGEGMLLRSAIATTVGLVLTTVFAGVVLLRVAGSFLAPLTLVRVGLALLPCLALGARVPHLGRPAVLVAAVGMVALYLLVLRLLGELGAADFGALRSVVSRRR